MFGHFPHNRLYLLYMILVKSTSNSAGKYLVSREWGSLEPKAFQGIVGGKFKLLEI